MIKLIDILNEAFVSNPPSREDNDFESYPEYIDRDITVHGLTGATIDLEYEDKNIGNDGWINYDVDLEIQASKFRPATLEQPAEGGVEDVTITGGINVQNNKPLSKNTIDLLNKDKEIINLILDQAAENYWGYDDEDYSEYDY